MTISNWAQLSVGLVHPQRQKADKRLFDNKTLRVLYFGLLKGIFINPLNTSNLNRFILPARGNVLKNCSSHPKRVYNLYQGFSFSFDKVQLKKSNFYHLSTTDVIVFSWSVTDYRVVHVFLKLKSNIVRTL